MKTKFLSLLALTFALPALCFASGQLTVKASNQLPITRASQTIELTGKDLDEIRRAIQTGTKKDPA